MSDARQGGRAGDPAATIGGGARSCWPLALAGMGLMGACLVTERVDFPFNNSPPVILSMEPDLLTHIPSTLPPVCRSSLSLDDRGFELSLEVRDPDVEDNLDVRVFVNDSTRAHAGFSLPPNGLAKRDRYPVCVPADAKVFSRACNLVDVRVSRDFKEDKAGEPKTEGDLARARILVLPAVEDLPGASSADCDALLAQLAAERSSGASP
jgi:hypothetical protein